MMVSFVSDYILHWYVEGTLSQTHILKRNPTDMVVALHED